MKSPMVTKSKKTIRMGSEIPPNEESEIMDEARTMPHSGSLPTLITTNRVGNSGGHKYISRFNSDSESEGELIDTIKAKRITSMGKYKEDLQLKVSKGDSTASKKKKNVTFDEGEKQIKNEKKQKNARAIKNRVAYTEIATEGGEIRKIVLKKKSVPKNKKYKEKQNSEKYIKSVNGIDQPDQFSPKNKNKAKTSISIDELQNTDKTNHLSKTLKAKLAFTKESPIIISIGNPNELKKAKRKKKIDSQESNEEEEAKEQHLNQEKQALSLGVLDTKFAMRDEAALIQKLEKKKQKKTLEENSRDIATEEFMSFPSISNPKKELKIDKRNQFKRKLRTTKKLTPKEDRDQYSLGDFPLANNYEISGKKNRKGRTKYLNTKEIERSYMSDNPEVNESYLGNHEINDQTMPLMELEAKAAPVTFFESSARYNSESANSEGERNKRHEKHHHKHHHKHIHKHKHNHKHENYRALASSKCILNADIRELPPDNEEEDPNDEITRKKLRLMAEMRKSAREAKFPRDPKTGLLIKYVNKHLHPDCVDESGALNLNLENLMRYRETDIGVRKQQEKIIQMKKKTSNLAIDELVDLASIRMKLDALNTQHKENQKTKKSETKIRQMRKSSQ